ETSTVGVGSGVAVAGLVFLAGVRLRGAAVFFAGVTFLVAGVLVAAAGRAGGGGVAGGGGGGAVGGPGGRAGVRGAGVGLAVGGERRKGGKEHEPVNGDRAEPDDEVFLAVVVEQAGQVPVGDDGGDQGDGREPDPAQQVPGHAGRPGCTSQDFDGDEQQERPH